MKYLFRYYGIPKGAQAKQAHSITSKSGKQFTTLYTPKQTRNIVADIRLQSLENRPPEPLDGPLAVTVTVILPIPNLFSAKKRDKAIRGEVLPYKKPDLDNVEKSLWDALQGIYYTNDSRICRKNIQKIYGEQPGMMVEIEEIIEGRER